MSASYQNLPPFTTQTATAPQFTRTRGCGTYTIRPVSSLNPVIGRGDVTISWDWPEVDVSAGPFAAETAGTAPFRLHWSTNNATMSPLSLDEALDTILPTDMHRGTVAAESYPFMRSSDTLNKEFWNGDLPDSEIRILSDSKGCPERVTVLQNTTGIPPGIYDVQRIGYEVYDIFDENPTVNDLHIVPHVWLAPDKKEIRASDGTRSGRGQVAIWSNSEPVTKSQVTNWLNTST